jgi:hypothetical protein
MRKVGGATSVGGKAQAEGAWASCCLSCVLLGRGLDRVRPVFKKYVGCLQGQQGPGQSLPCL